VKPVRRRFAIVGDGGVAGDVSDAAGALSDVAGGVLQAAGFIRTIATTKEAELEVPLCGACEGRWTRARRQLAAGYTLGFALAGATILWIGMGPRVEGTALYWRVVVATAFILAGVKWLPVWVKRKYVAPVALEARRIQPGRVLLGGVALAAVDADGPPR